MLYEDVFLKASIKLSGKVAIRLADNVPLVHATNRGLEMTYASQAETVLNRLFEEAVVLWDQQTNTITYRSLMVSASTTPHVPSTTVGLTVSSHKPTPVLRGEIRYPTLTGYIDRSFFTAMDVRVTIELEPKVPPVAKGPETVLEHPVLDRKPGSIYRSPDYTVAWDMIGEAAFLLSATILTDFIFGLGIFDDFVTVPAALTMMGRGVAMLAFPVIACSAGSSVCKTARHTGSGTALKAAHAR
jgi:hypothetical protein